MIFFLTHIAPAASSCVPIGMLDELLHNAIAPIIATSSDAIIEPIGLGGFFRIYWPALIAMILLLVSSAFFSSSEAAFFYLNRNDRRKLAKSGRLGQLSLNLLRNSEKLLTSILFWNLLINVLYFTISSIVSLKLERSGNASMAGIFAVSALMTLILLSEMLPKSLAVQRPRAVAMLCSVLLTPAVELVAPIVRFLQFVNLLSRRLFWPQFKPEPYLRASDLERAVELSTDDAALLQHEQQVLNKIVYLSDIRAAELMRPRTRLQTHRPPVSLDDLHGEMPSCGYLLISEQKTDEIVKAVPMFNLTSIPDKNLEMLAEPVVYVPWCALAADALEEMQHHRLQVAVVVNEYGETIGIITFEDILDTLFLRHSSRAQRLLNRDPIHQVAEDIWHLPGLAILKRIERYFNVELPPHISTTIGGVLQEILHRVPQVNDACDWGPFHLEVIESDEDGLILVELTMPKRQET